MDLSTKLMFVPGIGPSLSARLEKLNLLTVEDLIYHFPFRYDDFSNISTASEANIGEKVTITGEIWSIKNIYTRSRKVLTSALFNDGTTPIELTWFNQSYLTKSILVGDRLQISGKLTKYKNKLSIIAPTWEKAPTYEVAGSQPTRSNAALHTGKLVPIYPETLNLTSRWLRTKVALLLPQVLPKVIDPLPDFIKQDLIPLNQALEKIHLPENLSDVQQARQRLGFDEIFQIQLATQKARLDWQQKPIIQPFKISKTDLNKFLNSLPFKLTNSQLKVVDEIINDLKKDKPMNRLIQGEVGSGKTVVAALVIYLAFINNLKTFFMAPTEILAFQHYETIKRLLEPFGVSIGIYTGSKKFTKNPRPKNDQPLAEKLDPNVIIGTHALISEKLLPEDVGLVIIDEQQRFGVQQRSILRNKAKIPHFLTTTATPIPRTVALTLYGDLDISVIDELPKGRQKIQTFVVPNKKRADSYKFIHKQVLAGDQVYVITPLIELSEDLVSAKSAKAEFEKLQNITFPNLRLGLLHGRLKSKEKEEVLNKFKNGDLDILVSTSVVEVGVDIPNATIIVIESAERFGLAQLHQLRGRIGRGTKQSYCLLFSSTPEPSAISRLKNMETISSGLKLAELDLKIRGSGDIFGIRQSGRFDLKIATFDDLSLIEKSREAATKILVDDPKLDKYPALKAKLDSLMGNINPD